MSWAHPLVLLLLLLVPLVLLGGWSAASGRAWPTLAEVEVAGGTVYARAQTAAHRSRRALLLPLALALTIIALAGPRWGGQNESAVEPAREVMIALDLSRSMLVTDAPRSRIDRAHAVIQTLLDHCGGERVGLVVFSGGAYVQVPLSSDYQIFREFLPVLWPGYMPRGGSDYGAMLRAALDGFSADRNMDRYLVVIGDGESTTDDWPAEMARLRQRGIRVLGLGIGTAAGGAVPPRRYGDPSPAHSRLEAGTLQKLAAGTEGIYRDATTQFDAASLLAETVELGKKTRLAERSSERAADRFQWFLAAALAAGLAGLWRDIASRPRARAVARPSALGTTRSAIYAAEMTFAGLILAVLWLGGSAAPAGAHDLGDEADVPITAQGKLRKLVAHVAGHPALEVPDLLRIAELTVNYGIESFDKGDDVSEGVILDGLQAVRYGRARAPMLPEWDHLQKDLERLRLRQATSDAARRPPEEKKQSYDEEDRPQQTSGQGTQQTTSESFGTGGSALTDISIGDLGAPPPRAPGATPAPRRALPGTGSGAGTPGAPGGADNPIRKLLLKNLRDVVQEDQPGVLFQALSGDLHTEPAGGKDW
jgi:Ca-activated chloride channel family protein